MLDPPENSLELTPPSCGRPVVLAKDQGQVLQIPTDLVRGRGRG